jgi:hypothetical protein
MLVTSIDPLAAYKVSDDLILELMSVTASVEDDSEGASVGSGGNLKGSASDGNGWDDRTDLDTGSLQRATFRPRNHHPMHQVVPNVQAQLPRPRPDDGRAWHYVSSYDHPAMGAAVRA